MSIDRTFRSVFNLPQSKRQLALTKVAKHLHRNPIILAQEWQGILAAGKYASPAEMARRIGVSRARVTQVLQLLKLSPNVLDRIVALGDLLPSSIITERSLRLIVNMPLEGQNRWIAETLPERYER